MTKTFDCRPSVFVLHLEIHLKLSSAECSSMHTFKCLISPEHKLSREHGLTQAESQMIMHPATAIQHKPQELYTSRVLYTVHYHVVILLSFQSSCELEWEIYRAIERNHAA